MTSVNHPPSLYRVLNLAYRMDVGCIVLDGRMKSEMGKGSLELCIGPLSLKISAQSVIRDATWNTSLSNARGLRDWVKAASLLHEIMSFWVDVARIEETFCEIHVWVLFPKLVVYSAYGDRLYRDVSWLNATLFVDETCPRQWEESVDRGRYCREHFFIRIVVVYATNDQTGRVYFFCRFGSFLVDSSS